MLIKKAQGLKQNEVTITEENQEVNGTENFQDPILTVSETHLLLSRPFGFSPLL